MNQSRDRKDIPWYFSSIEDTPPLEGPSLRGRVNKGHDTKTESSRDKRSPKTNIFKVKAKAKWQYTGKFLLLRKFLFRKFVLDPRRTHSYPISHTSQQYHLLRVVFNFLPHKSTITSPKTVIFNLRAVLEAHEDFPRGSMILRESIFRSSTLFLFF